MYQSQFGLSRRPFSSTPEPDCLVPVGGMTAAISDLKRCAQGGQGIGILTAPAGLGKTILCRRLAESLREEFAVVFLPNANFPTRRSLLQALLYEMGHPYLRLGEQELRLEFTTAVRDLIPDRAGLVVIVDEAHLLHNRLLEELRTATHLVHDGEMLVRLILCGQLELEERLVKKDLSAINQRIVCHATLASLTLAESETYLRERLVWAGGNFEAIFADDAVRMICQASDGNPRCLNQLADHSLLLAAASQDSLVSTEHVLDSLDELRQLPLHWNHVQVPKPKPQSAAPIASNVSVLDDDEDCEMEEDGESSFIEFGPADADAVVESAVVETESNELQTPAEDAIEKVEEVEEADQACEIEITWDTDLDADGEEIDEVREESLEIGDDHVLCETPTEEADLPEDSVLDISPVLEDVTFEEEAVYDHYVQVLNGQPVEAQPQNSADDEPVDPVQDLRHEEDRFAVPPVSLFAADLTVIEVIPEPGDEWQPEDLIWTDRAPLAKDPAEVIDQVMPLIDAALNDVVLPEETEDEEIAIPIEAAEDCEPVVVSDSMEQLLDEISSSGENEPIARQESEPSAEEIGRSYEYFLMTPTDNAAGDLETEIAQMVLDVHGDVQPLIWSWSTDRETSVDPLPMGPGEKPIPSPGDQAPFDALRDTLAKAVDAIEDLEAIEETDASLDDEEYDIVMPDSDDEEPLSRTDAPEADAGPSPVLRPYKNLFSRVRRKEQA